MTQDARAAAEAMQVKCQTLRISQTKEPSFQADGYAEGWHDAIDTYRKTIRALPLPDVTGGWRLISDGAPKDGTVIVLGRHMEPWGFVRAFGYWVDHRGISGWIATGAAMNPPGVLGLAAPTHWLEIPAPPVSDTKQEKV